MCIFIYLIYEYWWWRYRACKIAQFLSLQNHFRSWPSEFISIITNWFKYWLRWPLVTALIQILNLAEAEHSLRQFILCCSLFVMEILKIYWSRENNTINHPCAHHPASKINNSKSIFKNSQLCPPVEICQCLETFLVVTIGRGGTTGQRLW